MKYYSPGSGPRTWHVVVVVGLVLLVADIVSIQMLGSKTNQFVVTPAQPAQPAADTGQKPTVPLPPGTELVSFPMWVPEDKAPFLVTGSTLDVIASLKITSQPKVFKLTQKFHLIAVDWKGEEGRPGTFMVSGAVTEKERRALTLAIQRGCSLWLTFRGDGNPRPQMDMDEVIQFLEALPLGGNPAEPRPVETVEVLVAAKDLPVGTVLTAGEAQWVKKQVAKEAVPPGAVATEADLTGQLLTRALRAGDAFDRRDVKKATGPALPDGHDMVSLEFNASEGSGFIVPGSRVNVLATLRVGNKLQAFPLLVNVLVVAVDTQAIAKDGPLPSVYTVSFAVKEKEALLLALAKQRGCHLSLLLRNPDKIAGADKNHDIDKVSKFLSELPEPIAVAPAPRPVDR